jgi:glyoxylase-like metal-dependent hydrolase (beta-lactamase superfamily II)/Tol biopolymer transport system component
MRRLGFLVFSACFILVAFIYTDPDAFPVLKGPYLGQKPPELTPELFAPGIITTEANEGCLGWGKEMEYFIFQRWIDGKSQLYIMNQKDGVWSAPEFLPFVEKYQVGDYMIAPDGKTMVFASRILIEEIGPDSDGANMWIIQKTETGWTEPKHFGLEINTKFHESYPCLTTNRNLYFFSRRPGGYGDSDLYLSEFVDGKHQAPVNLGPKLNTEYHEWDTYTAPDESYMIYCSMKSDSLGSDDLYVTFKNGDGSWSDPVHMGSKINSDKSENRPYVSPDGKYFFYTSTKRGNRDIYWVDAKIIEELKPDEASVEVSRIKNSIYKLYVNDFVNIVTLTGPEGILLVDTGFDETAAQVKSILREVGSGDIKYIINTHSDYDHIAGNSALRGNATVIAHAKCKSQLIEYADPDYDLPFDKALFRGAYPTLTLEESMTLRFNGEEIQIIPLTGGHTDEDIIVHFKNSGVVCLGDIVSPETFPVVKLNNGGNANTLVKNVEELLSLFPEDVTFIVGHGPDMTVKQLRAYHDMLQSTIAQVHKAIEADMTVEEMKRRNILKDWSSYNDPKYKETTAETWKETIFRSETPILKGSYLGQKPPGKVPEVFAPGVISTEVNEGCSYFSKDGNLYLFARGGSEAPGIYIMEQKNDVWSKPQLAPFSAGRHDWDFTLAPDGKTVYVASGRPHTKGGSPERDHSIWFSEKTRSGWTEAQLLPFPVNAGQHDSYPSITEDGTLFFFSRREGGLGEGDIYKSKKKDGKFTKVQNLGAPINTKFHEVDPFIAPDESYLIFCSDRPGGYGREDIYISFREEDGSWTEPVNLGEVVNTPYDEYIPAVTPDRKYFFFTTNKTGNRDIYWVDTKILFEAKAAELR